MPQDNSALNKEFLMAMMERNEEVEDAEDTETLEDLNAQLIKELEGMSQKLNSLFEKKDLQGVKGTLVEMKYLLSIQNSIKQKQQSLLGSWVIINRSAYRFWSRTQVHLLLSISCLVNNNTDFVCFIMWIKIAIQHFWSKQLVN